MVQDVPRSRWKKIQAGKGKEMKGKKRGTGRKVAIHAFQETQNNQAIPHMYTPMYPCCARAPNNLVTLLLKLVLLHSWSFRSDRNNNIQQYAHIDNII